MDKKEIARKIIDSYAYAFFAENGGKVYDKYENLDFAKKNGYIIVETQIKLIKDKEHLYLIPGTEGTDQQFWTEVNKEIKNFNWK